MRCLVRIETVATVLLNRRHLAFGMTLCMAVMMLIIRQQHETPMLPAACLSALLCPLIVWPVRRAALCRHPRSAQAVLVRHHPVWSGARVPDSRWSDGLHHGERADQHGGNATRCSWVWACFSEVPSVANFTGGMIVKAAVVGHIWHSNRVRMAAAVT
jgi:hypothetical protein